MGYTCTVMNCWGQQQKSPLLEFEGSHRQGTKQDPGSHIRWHERLTPLLNVVTKWIGTKGLFSGLDRLLRFHSLQDAEWVLSSVLQCWVKAEKHKYKIELLTTGTRIDYLISYSPIITNIIKIISLSSKTGEKRQATQKLLPNPTEMLVTWAFPLAAQPVMWLAHAPEHPSIQ